MSPESLTLRFKYNSEGDVIDSYQKKDLLVKETTTKPLIPMKDIQNIEAYQLEPTEGDPCLYPDITVIGLLYDDLFRKRSMIKDL